MAIVRYCILEDQNNQCVQVIDWDDSYVYTLAPGTIIAGDNTGSVGVVYTGGAAPGGTWQYPQEGPQTPDIMPPLPIEEGGTGADNALDALTNLGAQPYSIKLLDLDLLDGNGAVVMFAGQYALDGTSYQPLNADLTAIAAISGTSGYLKKTAANTWELDPNGGSSSPHTHLISDVAGLQAALDEKALLNSPVFTGAPQGPTEAAWANSTLLANTAHVYATVSSSPENYQTANYTLALADTGKTVVMDNSAARTITVPPFSSVQFPVNTRIRLMQTGTGALTVVAGSGVTVNSPTGLLGTGGRFVMCELWNVSQNIWVLCRAESNLLSSPALTGTPTAPTAAANTQSTQIATCQNVYDTATTLPLTQVLAPLTLALTHRGRLFWVDGSHVITIPSEASVNFPVGTRIDFLQWGTGQATFAITSGYIASYGAKNKLAGTGAGATLIKIATGNNWALIGQLG